MYLLHARPLFPDSKWPPSSCLVIPAYNVWLSGEIFRMSDEIACSKGFLPLPLPENPIGVNFVRRIASEGVITCSQVFNTIIPCSEHPYPFQEGKSSRRYQSLEWNSFGIILNELRLLLTGLRASQHHNPRLFPILRYIHGLEIDVTEDANIQLICLWTKKSNLQTTIIIWSCVSNPHCSFLIERVIYYSCGIPDSLWYWGKESIDSCLIFFTINMPLRKPAGDGIVCVDPKSLTCK